jgi:uncharacterized protein (DUF1800 family)
MTRDPRLEAAVALHRFGCGPRVGSIGALAGDARGALLAELEKPDAGRVNEAGLLSSAAASRAGYNFRVERQARQIAARQQKEGMENAGESKPDDETPRPGMAEAPANIQQQIFFDETKVRLDAALSAEIGFVERLVRFWSNHFCISADAVANMAGGYEREAIRAHVLGRFGDMLLAAESHPAMLAYLDNSRSVGPRSPAGLIQTRGLNENLAREILELHTLGVRSVYTQDDVTRFAKVLTGWTVIPWAGNPQHGAEFVFNPRMHEPGPQTILGKVYDGPGMDQGRAVLADLARHPATAAHIARKLARHFAADEPPPPLVERLSRCFLETDGDLKELAKVLVAAPECWVLPLTKLKRPSEWLVAGLRATGIGADPQRLLRAQGYLGEPQWRPPAPKGFADEQSAWVDGLAQRADIAAAFAERVGANLDPDATVETALGPLASAATRDTVARAESRIQALALLLMSPEFLRR